MQAIETDDIQALSTKQLSTLATSTLTAEQQEYAKINIPVLSITGYFDDGQISALEYYWKVF